VDEGAEVARVVKATLADGLPRLAVENLRVKFQFPDDFERLTLGIVVEQAIRTTVPMPADGWTDSTR